MKVPVHSYALTFNELTLYPTWFRWKLLFLILILLLKFALYPTWFRWKFANIDACNFSVILYIPHGSDERVRCGLYQARLRPLYPTWFRWKKWDWMSWIIMTYFISHMVQMKALVFCPPRLLLRHFISHMVQMKDFHRNLPSTPISTLYPTWFRWKQGKITTDNCSHPELYIPHGSDEREAPQKRPTLAKPLYPTWFRWKSALSITHNNHWTLYIPHGSDERKRDLEFPYWLSDLYIPHGSDESLKPPSFSLSFE